MSEPTNRRENASPLAAASKPPIDPPGGGEKTNTTAEMPKRLFGRTGVSISKLCLGGGSFSDTDSQALLDEVVKHGVDCWEIVPFTGSAYRDYFASHPGMRDRVFLSGKVYSTDPAIMQAQLDKTLEENGVSSVDFLAIHTINGIEELTADVRKWAEKSKKDGKIRFFGFCTHKNMDKCLNDAADLGWIDGIQTVYSYRLQGIQSMEDALQKCHDRGIGIFAIKSMGLGVAGEPESRKLPLNKDKLNSLLAGHGVPFEQAKLKAVWQNPHVTSICSLMPTVAIVQANASAATDECPLGAEARQLLATYADSTKRHFCRRCGRCETANADGVPVFSIMEMLMYLRSYGRFKEFVAKRFAQIPVDLRNKMVSSDYSNAEKLCPQNMPIAQLMKAAHAELSI